MGEALLEIHRVEFLFLVRREKLAGQDVGADERVAAHDVFVERGQERFVKFQLVVAGGAGRFVLQQFQVERELRHFHGLRVNVHAVDVGQQDFAFLLERQVQAVVAFHHVALFGLAGVVVVKLGVMANQQIIDAQQERAAAAGDVGKAHFGNLRGRFAVNQFADGVFDDVADDVFGRVINAAGLADFGLFLQPGAFVGGDDDLAEKTFVNAAEDVNGNGVEIVGRIEMGQAFADAGEGFVVQLEAGGVEDFVLFIDDAVVDAVEPAGFGDEILPGAAFVAEIGDAVLRLDVFVFEEAQEDEAIQRALGEFGQGVAVEFGILVFEGAGEFVAELVQFFEKLVVNV